MMLDAVPAGAGRVAIARPVTSLDRGQIGGARLDVIPREPTSADRPLRHRDDTIMTSHMGWYSEGPLMSSGTEASPGSST